LINFWSLRSIYRFSYPSGPSLKNSLIDLWCGGGQSFGLYERIDWKIPSNWLKELLDWFWLIFVFCKFFTLSQDLAGKVVFFIDIDYRSINVGFIDQFYRFLIRMLQRSVPHFSRFIFKVAEFKSPVMFVIYRLSINQHRLITFIDFLYIGYSDVQYIILSTVTSIFARDAQIWCQAHATTYLDRDIGWCVPWSLQSRYRFLYIE
jgi:hypothetical protein